MCPLLTIIYKGLVWIQLLVIYYAISMFVPRGASLEKCLGQLWTCSRRESQIPDEVNRSSLYRQAVEVTLCKKYAWTSDIKTCGYISSENKKMVGFAPPLVEDVSSLF